MPRRAFILVAGVLMNVILTWVLFSGGFALGFPQVIEDVSSLAQVRDVKIQVMSVLPSSPAAQAGIALGDELVTYDGHKASDIDAFRSRTKEGTPVVVEFRHAGTPFTRTLVPTKLPDIEAPIVGLGLAQTGIVSYPLWYAPIEGARATAVLAGQIVIGLGNVISALVAGRKTEVEFSGPIGIAVLTGEAARLGFQHLIQFTALLSLNLAIVNVFPFPALDGGRLLFILLERVRGRTFGRKMETYIHGIGFIILITLVLVVTARDVAKYGGAIWSALLGVFG